MRNIIYCNYHSYKYFEDYIVSIIRKVSCDILLYANYQSIQLLKDTRNIFIQSIPEKLVDILIPEYNVYLVNTEQMCRTYDDWKEKMNLYPSFVKMIDFSMENIKYYNHHNVFYIPYQVNKHEIYNFKKDLDICIMASGDGKLPEYRKHIFDKLQAQNINVTLVSGWGRERDEVLMRHKIIINLGYTPCARIMEQIRCNRCIVNKMIVISDKKIDEDYVLGKYIIFEEYDKIVSKVIDVYNNYEKYYQELFSDFTQEKLDNLEKIQESYLNILE